MMQKWHAFFARAKFPMTFADRDCASLNLFLGGMWPTPCLVAEGQSLFSFVAVDAEDYLKGYKISNDGNYVAGIGMFMGSDCLATTTNPTNASIFLPVFSAPMTYSVRNMGDETVLTRPWDFSGDDSGAMNARRAILLATQNDRGFAAVQQVFKMPGWPVRLLQMAYVPTGVHFYLQSDGKNLYASGSQLAWGTTADATAVCAVATPDPGSVHAGYALSVGGKYLQMTAVDSAVSLVDDMASATRLCAIFNNDGSLSFWHCESDHVLTVKNGLPVFTLCDDPQAVPPSWTAGDHTPHPQHDLQLQAAFDQLQVALDTPKSLDTTTYIKPIVASLKQTDLFKRRATWDYSFNSVFAADWLISTPENAFGSYTDFEMPIIQQGANDFNLKPCDGSPPDPKHPCVALASSVNTPGGTPLQLHAGQSRVLYEEMYKLITSGAQFIDITGLLRNTATPSGEFLAAIRNAITYLSKKPEAQNIIIRLLFGEPLGWAGDSGWLPGTGPYQSAPDLLTQLTRDIPSTTTSRMKIYVAYTSSVPSITWNHSKIIAVDAQRAMVGGHNMWAEPYLRDNPVLDVSLKLSGMAAVDVHRFADNLWFEQVIQHGDYWVADSASFSAPATVRTGQSAVPLARLFDQYYSESADNPAREAGTGTPVLSVGREEGTVPPNAPSDKALLALITLATQSIYISAQAMSHDPVYPRNWPEDFLNALAAALVRSVQITIFMSDPSDGSYKGDPPADVVSQIQNRITGKSSSEIDTLMSKLSVRSFPPASQWGLTGQPGISNHGKVLMIDKKAFSIGSQNFYLSSPATMSEFTYIVEDASLAGALYDNYFAKLEAWARPAVGIQPLVDRSTYLITLLELKCITVSDSGWAQIDPDQCFLTQAGQRIWPQGVLTLYTLMEMGSLEQLGNLHLPQVAELDNEMIVNLYEWDFFSDDLLGQFVFHPDTPIRYWTASGSQTGKLADLTQNTAYEMQGNMIDDKAVYHLTFSFLRISPA
jgi:hypothetical protein